MSADGGSRGNPGPAAYGTLVSDSAGNVIVEIAEFFDHETNNFAEYRGAIAGLEFVVLVVLCVAQWIPQCGQTILGLCWLSANFT